MKGYIPSNLNLGSERNPDKYYYIITRLHYAKIFDKRETENSFIPLSSKILYGVLGGRYKEYIQKLIYSRIIETDNQYLTGRKSKGYRLTRPYRNVKTREVEIKNLSINEKAKLFKMEQEKMIKLDQHKYLYNCLQNISIDATKAYDFIEANCTKIEEYNSYTTSVNMIDSKSFFFVVDSTAGRVHTNISNLSSNLRPYLKYEGKNLVEIDIANSQPFIFNILIQNYLNIHYPDYKDANINLSYVPQYLIDTLIYRKLTSSGKFYEYLMDKLRINEDRSEFKVRFFKKVFFSKDNPNYVTTERKQFKKLFPTVSAIISYYKKDDYRQLAVNLQRAEADIIINSVVKKLAENGIFLLTIHDSILTTPDNTEIVKKAILNEFQKQFGLTPTLKIKGA